MRSGTAVADNIAAASALIRQAAGQGAELIATPEMTTLLDRKPGAVFEKSTTEEADPGLAAFRALAAELQVTLLIGSIAIRAGDGKCANRSFLIGPDGEIVAWYDKIHMFDVQLNAGNIYRESDSFAAGGEAVIADLPAARLGMTVCYDVRFPDPFPCSGVERCEHHCGSGGVYPHNRRSPLAYPAAFAGDRNRLLHHRAGAGRQA